MASPPTPRPRTTPVATHVSPNSGGFRISPPSSPPSLPSSPLSVRNRSSISIPLLRPRLPDMYLNLNRSLSSSSQRHLSVVSAASLDSFRPVDKDGPKFQAWDSITAKFAGAANIPFLLLQLPQIILNTRNLLDGNTAALSAVPWLGMLTGLLGNLSLLSYFATKKETEAAAVQTLGAISNYIVLVQLSIAKAMPLPHFVATTTVVFLGMALNLLNYLERLPEAVWNYWEDFITIGGIAVLPQVMWATFVPFVPSTILPGMISLVVAITAVTMARLGKLSEAATRFVGSVSGWTATLLFMWMPVTQMWTNYLNPDNIRGLSAFSMVLAMFGNGFMLPRAFFIRDLMWFTGSFWATLLYGWGNLFCMYCFHTISKTFIFGATAGLLLWIAMFLWRDTIAHGNRSPFTSIKELLCGSGNDAAAAAAAVDEI